MFRKLHLNLGGGELLKPRSFQAVFTRKNTIWDFPRELYYPEGRYRPSEVNRLSKPYDTIEGVWHKGLLILQQFVYLSPNR